MKTNTRVLDLFDWPVSITCRAEPHLERYMSHYPSPSSKCHLFKVLQLRPHWDRHGVVCQTVSWKISVPGME